ncbi:hypothetical protein [Tepidimonas sp. HKU79]|uniref:hypothetical protein n=1 Tax=Tepidimonas sp. HKU79 TaxID=3414505 RepID=UPI003C7C5FBA
MNLPLEIYDLLERRLGRDDAMAVAKSIEASLTHIEERSREMAVQRKIEAKEELRIELRSELATKEDLLAVKEDLLAVREGMSCFLCVGRFLNLSSCRSAWCEGEAVAV